MLSGGVAGRTRAVGPLMTLPSLLYCTLWHGHLRRFSELFLGTCTKFCVTTTTWKGKSRPQKQGEGKEADSLPPHPPQYIEEGWSTGLFLHAYWHLLLTSIYGPQQPNGIHFLRQFMELKTLNPGRRGVSARCSCEPKAGANRTSQRGCRP